MRNWSLALVITSLLATAADARSASPGDPVTIPAAELPVAAFVDAGAPVRDVVVSGVTRYTPLELLRFALAHDHTSRGHSTLQGTADAVSLIYREDGYLLADARVRYDAAAERVDVLVEEGHVGRITIEGLRPAVARLVEQYVRPLLGRRPLTRGAFERAFMLASDLTGVYLRSEFSFAPGLAGADLRIVGSETRQAGSVTAETLPLRPDTGGRAYVVQEGHGVARGGDMLRVVGVLTLAPQGTRAVSGTAFYRLPLGRHGTYLEAFGGNAFSRRDFGSVALRSDQLGLNGAVAVGHPVHRDLDDYVYVIGEYEFSAATSRIGADSIDSGSQSLRMHLVHGHTAPAGGLFQWSLTVSGGTRADRAPDEPADGARRFAHARGSVGSVTALSFLSDRTYLRVEGSGQWTTTALPLVEQFGLGFMPHLRDYTQWEVTGDRAFAADVEVSYLRPTTRVGVRELMPFVFIDTGVVDHVAPTAGVPPTWRLASAGTGVRFAFKNGFSAGAWMGVPLRDGPQSEKGKPAFYVRLTRGWGR